MSEEESRVILYSDLRKKISNMDVYSFQETKNYQKNLPNLNNDDNKEKQDLNADKQPIKKNTLSLSIDELIKENDKYQENILKETKKEYKEQKKKNHKKTHTWLWILIAVICAILIILIILILAGVF